jgi:DNA mismatch endonuclease Vsr
MDKLTVEQRSRNMSHVRSKNTKPELFVFKALDKMEITYEKHFNIHGKPDIAFPDKKIAVFINGEFWHGRNFNKEKEKYQKFWVDKISKNIARDRKNFLLLKKEGWSIIKIWDKDIEKHPKREIGKIMKAIRESVFY